MSKWQPIETAPKDGDPFIAAWDGKTVIAAWADLSPQGYRWDCFVSLPGFGRPYAKEPTHWMPLPDPPEID